jgi:glycine/D-amino acid oxidase-like deaminating enzyme
MPLNPVDENTSEAIAIPSTPATFANTLVYADISDEQASAASSIASTMQQMSISFGVATASLVTAVFLPDRFRANPEQFIHGIHKAFWALGGMTVLSTSVLCELKRGDGGAVSRARQLHP